MEHSARHVVDVRHRHERDDERSAAAGAGDEPGLEAKFDPTKQWNSSSLDAYYSAFNSTNAYHGNNSGSNGYLGKNPYGDWGAASAIQSGSDQKANIAQEGDTPDVARFAGAKPTHSFLSKYGGDIVSIAGDVAGSFVGDPMAGNQIMAVYDATQGNWAGALGNAASSFVPGLGAAAGSALNIGTTAGGALVGAGVGAAEAGLTKGNPLLGALGGAASGAIGSSGIKGDVSGAVSGTVGNTAGNVLGSVAQGGLNVGAGMAVGALGAEMAGGSSLRLQRKVRPRIRTATYRRQRRLRHLVRRRCRRFKA